MRQYGDTNPAQSGVPSYAALLLRLRERIGDLVDEVVRDVAGPDDVPSDVAHAVRPAVLWTLETLAEPPPIAASRLDELRDEGRRAAADGEPLQAVLDRYLSTGWVVAGARGVAARGAAAWSARPACVRRAARGAPAARRAAPAYRTG